MVENSSAPLELVLERPVAGGRMLARDDGRVVLVAGGIPGERVRVRLERATRKVAWAEVIEVLEPSPDRREPAGDPACGGAVFAHVAYARQRQLKGEIIADAFRRIGKITVPAPDVAASPEDAFRLRARLHVREGRLGFFREGTHVLCDAAMTRQLHAGAIGAASAAAQRLGDRLDDCDEIVVAENVRATERVLHLVPRPGRRLDDLEAAMAGIPDATGVTTDAAGRVVRLAGEPRVRDSAIDLMGADPPIDGSTVWVRQAASFFQANRFLVGALVRGVLDATDTDTCIDLYSGVGLFAAALAARGAAVTAVEGDPVSAGDLAVNAERWAPALTVAVISVERFVSREMPVRPGAVVLDPPRTGASPEALDGLLRWHAPAIVYVSCDPPTLARDAARIIAAGYELRTLKAYDLFPNTAHVETVAVFTF